MQSSTLIVTPEKYNSLTQEQQKALDAELKKLERVRHESVLAEARSSLLAFGLYINKALKPYHHTKIVTGELEEFAFGGTSRLILTMGPQHGKALALDTPIPTPNGWTSIGDLRPGDALFDKDGNVCHVTNKTPIWRNRECYVVSTDDNDSIIADAKHEWRISLKSNRERVIVRDTKFLANKRKKRARINIQGPLKLPEARLPIDPYILGLWLGDGASNNVSFTASDEDVDFFRSYCDQIGLESRKLRGLRWSIVGIRKSFATLGLIGEYERNKKRYYVGRKFIPAIYLRASIEQRKKILQGLIDSDGYVASDGRVEFCNTNYDLADGVRELVRSLGIKVKWVESRATLYGKDCGPKYRVFFYYAEAALLPRKRNNCRNAVRQPNRYVNAELTKNTDTVCIEVDSPSHTFLCGRSMLPTCNSLWSSILLPAYILGRNPDAKILLLSYGASLSSEFNSAVQKVMDTEEYAELFPDSVLNKENIRTVSGKPRRNSDIIEIPNHGGMFVNAGIGGGYTGKGFNFIILDDLIKSRDEADSPTYREATDTAYTDTIRTRRVNDRAKVLILNTRWHVDDLTGRRLKAAQENPLRDQWRVVNLPELLSDCEDPEAERWKFPAGQEPGKEVLWPEHFSYNDVIATKAENPFNFSAQYMGTPIAREGHVIKRAWFPLEDLFDYRPEHRPVVLYFDLGGSSQPTADRTVGTLMTQYRVIGDPNPRTILLHQMSGQWDSPDREERMLAYCLAVNELFPGIPIWLENTFGLAVNIAPNIRNYLLNKGLNVMLDTVKISKFARAEPFLASARAGRVSLYSGPQFNSLGYLNWRNDFLDEVTMLQQRETPRGPEFFGGHDDRLDSPDGGFNKLVVPPKTKPSKEPILFY